MEQELERIVAASGPPAEQFVRFIVRQYELKRERAMADPELFCAYLEPVVANMAAVERHLNRMRAQLEAVMQRCADRDLIGGRDPAAAAALVEAMTTRFRDAALILRYLDVDSSRRAAEAAGVILAGLAHLPR